MSYKPHASTQQGDASTLEELEYRKKQRRTRLISWVLGGITLILCGFGLYSIYMLVKDGQQIEFNVVGIRNTQEQQLVTQQLSHFQQNHYFTVNLVEIRDTLLKEPWIDEVIISRAWPKTIQVNVVPRQAVARWGQTDHWVSDSGEIFNVYYGQNAKYLPSISGPADQTKHIMRTFQEIERLFNPLGIQLTYLHLTERMTWLMQFDNGLRVIVDQDQTMKKLRNLSIIAQQDLKPVWSRISSIDLRYRNGLAIQWRNAQPAKYEYQQFMVDKE